MAELKRIAVNETVRPVEGASPRGFAAVARAGGEIAATSQFLQRKQEQAMEFVEGQLADLAANSVTLKRAEREYQFNVDGKQLTLRDQNGVVRPFIPPGISAFDQKYRKAVQTQYENEVETNGRTFLTKLAVEHSHDPVKFLTIAEQYINATTEATGLDSKSKLWNDLTRSATAMYHGLAQQKTAKDYRTAVRTSNAEVELGYRDLSRMANAGLSPLQVTPDGVVDNKDVLTAVRRTMTGIYRLVELGEYTEPMAEAEARKVFDLWAVEQVQGQLTSAHDRLVKQGLKEEALQAELEVELQKLISGDTRIMYPEFNRETGEVRLRPRAIADVVGAADLPKLQQSLRGMTRAYQELSTQSRQIEQAAGAYRAAQYDAGARAARATGQKFDDSGDALELAMARETNPIVIGQMVRDWNTRKAQIATDERMTSDVVQSERLLPHMEKVFLELGSVRAVREAFPELFTQSSLDLLNERVASLPEREKTLRSWIAWGTTIVQQGQREAKVLADINSRIGDVQSGLAPRPLTMEMAMLRGQAVKFEGGWKSPVWVQAFTPGDPYNTPEITAVVPMEVWQGLRGFLAGQQKQDWNEQTMRHAQQLATLIVRSPMLKDQAGASWAMGESGMRALNYLAESANVGALVSDPKEMEKLNRIMSDQKIADSFATLSREDKQTFYKVVDEVIEKAGGDVPATLRGDIVSHVISTSELSGMDKALIKGTVEGYTRRLIEEGSYGPSLKTIPLGGVRQTNERRWAYAPIELRYNDEKWLDQQLAGIGRRLTQGTEASNAAGVALVFSGRKQNAWVVPYPQEGKLKYGIAMVTKETRAGEKPMLTPVVTGSGKPFTFDLDPAWETHQKVRTGEEFEKLMAKHRRIIERAPEPSYWSGR